MEKLSISKLIANDIVNYGMDKTMGFNYIVSLNEFLDDYNEDTCNYIKSHINEIIEDVGANENVADLNYDDKRQEFDMVFYFDNLMTPLERRIMDEAKELNHEYEIDEVRQISYEIETSDEYKNLIIDSINKNLNMGREM